METAYSTETPQPMAYANVAHLDGGFTAWKAANRPVDDAKPA